jgi:general secretion pathway protein J
MKRVPSRQQTAGFTLVEFLTATVLLMIIVMGLSEITRQWLPNWTKGVNRIQRVELLAAALDRLAADIGAAEFISAARDDQIIFIGSQKSIVFARTALGPNTKTGLEVIRIAEMMDRDGPALVREVMPFAFGVKAVSGNEPDFSAPVVLYHAPFHTQFFYGGPDGVWHDAWQGMAQLPRAIRVRIEETNSQFALTTTVFLSAEVAARCVAAKTLAECRSNAAGALAGNVGASLQVQ